MYKKLLVSIAILLALVFSFTVCFANNGFQNAVDGVRNVVGGAENTIENAAKDISNTSKNATQNMENGANNLGNTMANNNNSNKNTTGVIGNNGSNNDGRYTATRTATTNNATFMGMSSTAWTWLIIGIAAIGIIAVVWYYSMQLNSSNYDNRNE